MTRFALLTFAAVTLLSLPASPLPSSEPNSPPAAAAVVPEASVSVTIDGPDEVALGGFALVGSSDAADAVLRWRVETPEGAAGPLRLRDESGRPVLVFLATAEGRYRVVLTAQVPTDGLDPFGEAVHVVQVGPQPTPGPGPDDDDTDPDPEPDQKPPFPADGLHVLIVYEASDTNGLTSDQRAIIGSDDVRDALKAACPEKDGTDTFRIYPEGSDVSLDEQVWQDAMRVPRESLPWVTMSNGKTGFSGPLDMTTAEFKSLIERHK